MKTLRILALSAVVAAGAGAFALYAGWYNISATDQHLAPTYWLLETGMRESIERRARGIAVPALDEPSRAERGFAPFDAHCVQCHGAPGIAPAPFALGMTPVPANLSHAARHWAPAELFWAIKYGIKMTGMPAWSYRLSDDDIWSVVAFMQRLPQLTPRQYAALQAAPPAALSPPSRDARPAEAAPDAARGRTAIQQYACVTCHRIPGVVGANAPVGPPLDGIASRRVLAGRLPNTPENMVRWLRTPQAVSPGSAMPDLGVSEGDARDIAAYLATLR